MSQPDQGGRGPACGLESGPEAEGGRRQEGSGEWGPVSRERALGTFRRLSQVRGGAVATAEGTVAATDRGLGPWEGMKQTHQEVRAPTPQPREPRPDPGAASCEQTISRVPSGRPRHPGSPEAAGRPGSDECPLGCQGTSDLPLCVQAAPQTGRPGVPGSSLDRVPGPPCLRARISARRSPGGLRARGESRHWVQSQPRFPPLTRSEAARPALAQRRRRCPLERGPGRLCPPDPDNPLHLCHLLPPQPNLGPHGTRDRKPRPRTEGQAGRGHR